MARLTRDDLLRKSDLREEEVGLPSLGGSVLVRSLPAAYSNQAQSEATELVQLPGGEQSARINTAKLEALQVLHGLVDPQLRDLAEVEGFATRVGAAWRLIVHKIDEISGIDKQAIEDANARFHAGGETTSVSAEAVDETAAGGGGSDIPARVGA